MSGCTSSSIAFWRPSRSVRADCWNSAERVAGELEERLVVVAKRLGREGGERVAKLDFRVTQELELGLARLAFRIQLRLDADALLARSRKFTLQPGKGQLSRTASCACSSAARREASSARAAPEAASCPS